MWWAKLLTTGIQVLVFVKTLQSKKQDLADMTKLRILTGGDYPGLSG